MVVFLFLFKLVGESAPLPKPRKINASRLSASKSLNVFKQKVTPPLAPPRTLNKSDNANVSLDECINSKHFEKACCSTSIFDDTSSLNEYDTVMFKPKETCSKSKDYKFFDEDQKKALETIGNITAKNTSLKSSAHSNHVIKSNCNIQNSIKLIRVESEEEVYSKSEDEFSNIFEDKFNQKKKVLNIADVADNRKSLNLNLYLSNKKYTMLDSIELNVSPVKSLLSECNIISNIILKENENNSLEQDYKMTFENIDSYNENEDQRDNPQITLDNDSLSASMTKLECMTEPSNELKLLHHQFACQKSLNAQRKTISFCEIEENTEAVNLKDTCSAVENSDSEKDKKMCTIISTIPKCERFDAVKEDGALNNIAKRVITENVDNLCERCENCQNEELNGARSAKRTRIIRSQSKSNDFETDILKRQRRYFTLPSENIAHALNLNIPARNPTSFDITEKNWKQIVTGHCTDHAENVDINKGKSYGELITGACCCTINFYFHLYYLFRKFFILSAPCPIKIPPNDILNDIHNSIRNGR